MSDTTRTRVRLTTRAHTWAGSVCPSVGGNNSGDSPIMLVVRDAIAEHFAAIEGQDVEKYDATAYELATMLERRGLLAGAPVATLRNNGPLL